jgi:hypothetical protein
MLYGTSHVTIESQLWDPSRLSSGFNIQSRDMSLYVIPRLRIPIPVIFLLKLLRIPGDRSCKDPSAVTLAH